MTTRSSPTRLTTIRALAAIGLFSASFAVFGCEPRSSPSESEQPSKPADSPRPAPPSPTPKPTPLEPAAAELPELAGVHYLEIVTAGADPDAELPMLVAIHGLGDTPEAFAGLLAQFDRPVRLILPRGLDAHEPGWSWFPLRARDLDVEGLSASIGKAADTLAPMIASLAEQRPTRGKPIITGFSQGGMLTFTLAVHHGELFAAAFPVGGWLPPPLWPTSADDPTLAPPIVAFHGDEDRAVKYEPTVAAITTLQTAGYQVELHTYPGVGHAIPPDMRTDLLAAIRVSLDQPDPPAQQESP